MPLLVATTTGTGRQKTECTHSAPFLAAMENEKLGETGGVSDPGLLGTAVAGMESIFSYLAK